MNPAVIGIDPGATGAAALYSREAVEVHDFRDEYAAALCLGAWLARFEVGAVGLERVHSMPRDGHVGAFAFGKNFGAWLGILAALGVGADRLRLIDPRTWQKAFPGLGKGDKSRSIDMVRGMFPLCRGMIHLKKHHNRAEAVLIAWYVYGRQSTGGALCGA